MADDSGRDEGSSRRALEMDLRDLVGRIAEAERAAGTNRSCSYGVGPDGGISLEAPTGYEDEVEAVRARHRAPFVVTVSEWALLVDWTDGTGDEARDAALTALAARGIDPASVDPGDLRLDIGGYRGKDRPPSPYFRAWVRQSVLD